MEATDSGRPLDDDYLLALARLVHCPDDLYPDGRHPVYMLAQLQLDAIGADAQRYALISRSVAETKVRKQFGQEDRARLPKLLRPLGWLLCANA